MKSQLSVVLCVSLFSILVMYSVETSALDLSALPSMLLSGVGLSDFDSDKFFAERGSLVGWGVVLVVVLIIFGIYICIRNLRRKGMEYGLTFMKSFQFWLLVAATTFFWFSLLHCQGTWTTNAAGESQCIQSAEQALIVFQNAGFVFLGFFVVAFLLNWRKSNLIFALVFTTVQSIVAGLSILLVIVVVIGFVLYMSSDYRKQKLRRG